MHGYKYTYFYNFFHIVFRDSEHVNFLVVLRKGVLRVGSMLIQYNPLRGTTSVVEPEHVYLSAYMTLLCVYVYIHKRNVVYIVTLFYIKTISAGIC